MTRLAIVELKFRNWASAVAWYRSTFELKLVMESLGEQYALLETGKVLLAIKHDAVAQVTDQISLQWEVDDLDVWLKQKPVNVLKPMKDSTEGYRRVIIEGPEGQPLLVYDWKKNTK